MSVINTKYKIRRWGPEGSKLWDLLPELGYIVHFEDKMMEEMGGDADASLFEENGNTIVEKEFTSVIWYMPSILRFRIINPESDECSIEIIGYYDEIEKDLLEYTKYKFEGLDNFKCSMNEFLAATGKEEMAHLNKLDILYIYWLHNKNTIQQLKLK